MNTWTAEKIREKLATSKNPWWVTRAVLAIYYRHQKNEDWEELSGGAKMRLGFIPVDVEDGCWLAKTIIEDGGLSPKVLEYARTLILDYSEQLEYVAAGHDSYAESINEV